MELYYKPNNRGGARIEIPDDAPKAFADAQRAIASSQGLLPVSNWTPRPKGDMFEMVVGERFLPVTDEYGGVTGYSHAWEIRPRRIKLSQAKLMADKDIAPILQTLAPAVAENPSLSAWWANDMTYVRGSEMANLAMQTLGISRDKLEEIVIRCKA